MEFGSYRIKYNSIPAIGEIVVCQISQVTDYGVKCRLMEYGGLEGLILNHNYSRRMYHVVIHPVIGSIDFMCVLNTAENGIDLSKREVTLQQRESSIDNWEKCKQADLLMRIVAKKLGLTSAEAYDRYRPDGISLYEFICGLEDNPDIVLGNKFLSEICREVQSRKIIPMKTYRAEMRVDCLTGGVDALKDGFAAARARSMDVKITVVACPYYNVWIRSKKNCSGLIREVCGRVVTEITKGGGTARVVRDVVGTDGDSAGTGMIEGENATIATTMIGMIE